jgi:hypothetical protein
MTASVDTVAVVLDAISRGTARALAWVGDLDVRIIT